MSVAGYVEQLRREQPARRGLSADARAFLFTTLALALTATLAASLATRGERVRWADFTVVAVAAAAAQLFATPVGANQGFHTGLAFAVTAALLLPPELVVFVCVFQHLPDWARNRYRWYVQVFNITNYSLSALAAWGVARGAAALGADVATDTRVTTVLAGMGAVAAFVLVNHLLLARMLMLARGRDMRTLFSLDSIVTDVVLAGTGMTVAFALLHEPALAPVAALPLVLIHRALVVPTLRRQAFRDHKTGLLNLRGFEPEAAAEFARSRRFGRPLSVLLCDVDDLRGINQHYGHLGGDAALVTLADAFRAELRSFDLCARFGGDEFLVLLPETSEEEALAVAGRVREWLGRNPVVTQSGPVPVGVSIGAARREDGDESLDDVVARADTAMYASKQSRGRLSHRAR